MAGVSPPTEARVNRVSPPSRFVLLAVLAVLCAAPAARGQAPAAVPKKVVRATVTTARITVDGELDEPAWQTSELARDFIQREPIEGAPATEWTEVRILYDRDTLYIGAYCHDRTPGRIVINDISRDFDSGEQDYFGIILDTFNDDSSGYYLVTTPVGGNRDLQFFNEARDSNLSWDGVWHAEARVHDDYWTAEVAIPFKTLRFPKATEQVWGAQFFRRIRRNNEGTYWSPIPRRYTVTRAVAFAGELRGVRNVEPGRNLYVKPYALAGAQQFASRHQGAKGDFDAGLDIKYGVASNLVLDVTANTDFSQVEVDTQQVNLTRFPILFPEKREFFLENAGIFVFGAPQNNEALLFQSRTIGLAGGQVIPILAGTRLTGRVGRNTLGLLNMQTRSEGHVPATNFTVARLRRDILSASNVGVIALNRNRQTRAKDDSNRALGVDSNFLFFHTDLRLSQALARTWTPGREGHDWLGRIEGEWQNDLLRAFSSYVDVQKNFNPAMGFVRRPGRRILRDEFEVRPRFAPQTRVGSMLRDLSLVLGHQLVLFPGDTTPHAGSTETRSLGPALTATFQDGSFLTGQYTRTFERLIAPSPIPARPGAVIPVGDYRDNASLLSYSSDRSKPFAGTLSHEWGGFYDGGKKTTKLSGTYRPSYRFSASASYEINDVDLPSGAFTTRLAGLRASYTFTPKLNLNAFLQYNSSTDQFSSNVRLRFIHRPLSDIFVVFNEQRDWRINRNDRTFTVKYTHLLPF